MKARNDITLAFNYTMWSCPIDECDMTKSKVKMKKIIEDSIRRVLSGGYSRWNENEDKLELSIPFFFKMNSSNCNKIKIDFSDDCEFKCEKMSSTIKNRHEFGEISVDGNITITLKWTA